MNVDLGKSRLSVRTTASGLLARLAHDLEIGAERFSIALDAEGERWSAELTVPVAALVVRGALKQGRVDAAILSPSDRADIEARIRKDALPGESVTVKASGDRRRGEATVKTPKGSQRVDLELTVAAASATARCKLSLRALGVPEIKAPLGAFKLDDEIAVTIELALT